MKKTTESFPFADQIMEDHPTLHFISFTKDAVLAVSNKTNKAHFFYAVNDDLSFHFNLLSEVGASYQHWFLQIMQALNIVLGTKETESDYFNTIIFK